MTIDAGPYLEGVSLMDTPLLPYARIALCAFMGCALFAPTIRAERDTRIIDDAVYRKAQVLVEIEKGRALNLHCIGKGTPIVVFDTGLGDGTKAWALVQPEIAKHTKACSYDRAGLGFSDSARAAGTSANAVGDLRKLLRAAKLEPPYVLVGHSYGGMNVKLYAESYPEEVSALVLVDPSHEDLGRDIAALDPNSDAANRKYLAELKRCALASSVELSEGTELFSLCVGLPGERYGPHIRASEGVLAVSRGRISAWISEMTYVWTKSADQVRSAYRRLGAIPIIVLTKEPAAPGPNESAALRNKKNEVWIRLHDQIAAMSTRGERITIADTGHYIQLDQPSAVTDAVARAIRIAATNSSTK
jgi:pimeloyl-ACP methyl ester carboxylesterase